MPGRKRLSEDEEAAYVADETNYQDVNKMTRMGRIGFNPFLTQGAYDMDPLTNPIERRKKSSKPKIRRKVKKCNCR
jgi:hypothetical protein